MVWSDGLGFTQTVEIVCHFRKGGACLAAGGFGPEHVSMTEKTCAIEPLHIHFIDAHATLAEVGDADGVGSGVVGDGNFDGFPVASVVVCVG